ncbi:MAG: LLM class flavin-dependent oxidoreductase, partial [Actinobacteria bacterium]|nr:LLM class flavin-dependent oxidoreductase [Actinomycetota bacterium]
MLIGVVSPPDVDTSYAELAEELGLASFYSADNSLIWSDTYATMALLATRTERIKLGSMVAVAGSRSPIVTATALGTINRLALGRVSCSVGTGNSTRHLMGKRPLSLKSYEAWIRELRPLLNGEEIEKQDRDGNPIYVGHVAKEKGFVSFEPRIPLYLSGYGPKAIAMAGALGDGLVGIPALDPEQLEGAWKLCQDGAAAVGREITPDNFFTSVATTICVLEDGEAIDSPRVKEETGALALVSLHYAYTQNRQHGAPPPPFVEDVWEEYVAMIEATPADRRHQRIHNGHNTWMYEAEEKFVTPELIQA